MQFLKPYKASKGSKDMAEPFQACTVLEATVDHYQSLKASVLNHKAFKAFFFFFFPRQQFNKIKNWHSQHTKSKLEGCSEPTLSALNKEGTKAKSAKSQKKPRKLRTARSRDTYRKPRESGEKGVRELAGGNHQPGRAAERRRHSSGSKENWKTRVRDKSRNFAALARAGIVNGATRVRRKAKAKGKKMVRRERGGKTEGPRGTRTKIRGRVQSTNRNGSVSVGSKIGERPDRHTRYRQYRRDL